MTVYFIGAGPGAPDLLTLRADGILKRVPIVIYAGSLLPPELPRHYQKINPEQNWHNSGDLDLGQIIELFERAQSKNEDIARLHSGDLSLFCALEEQLEELRRRNIEYELIPGVPAYAACAAAIGKSLTQPGISQTIVLTRPGKGGSDMPDGHDLKRLARQDYTLCIHLPMSHIEAVVEELKSAYGADISAAVVSHASTDRECKVMGTLNSIAAQCEKAGIKNNTLLIVGHVLGEISQNQDKPKSRSKLYSSANRARKN